MKLGVWNVTASAFAVSTTWAPNQLTTSYAWYRVGNNWDPSTFTNTFQFKAQTTGTLATDWFIDEACLVPKSVSGGNGDPKMPQDLWTHWMFDRSVKQVID